jgi:hypothetical protein
MLGLLASLSIKYFYLHFSESFKIVRNRKGKDKSLVQNYKLKDVLFFAYLNFSTYNLSFQAANNLENDSFFDIYS